MKELKVVETELFGLIFGVQLRIGGRPGGEGQDGKDGRCEQGKELFHLIGFF